MSTPIFGIGAEGINPSAIQSKFITTLTSNNIVLSEFALAQLFAALHRKVAEKDTSPILPFPLTSTVKGATTHAKKFHSVVKVAKPGIKLGLAQTMYANTYGYKQWESMMIDLRAFETRAQDSAGRKSDEAVPPFPVVLGKHFSNDELARTFPAVRNRTPIFIPPNEVAAIGRHFQFDFIPLGFMESLNPRTSPTIKRINQISLKKMGFTINDEGDWFGTNSCAIIGFREAGDAVWVKDFPGKGCPVALPFREVGFLYLNRLFGGDPDTMAGYFMDLIDQFTQLPEESEKDASYTNAYFIGLVMAAYYERITGKAILKGVIDDIITEASLCGINKNDRYLLIEFADFVEKNSQRIKSLAAGSDDPMTLAKEANTYYHAHFVAPHIEEGATKEEPFDLFEELKNLSFDNFMGRMRFTHAINRYERVSGVVDITDIENRFESPVGHDYASTTLREKFPAELQALFDRKYPVLFPNAIAKTFSRCLDIYIDFVKDKEVQIKKVPLIVFAAFCLNKKISGPASGRNDFYLRLNSLEIMALRDFQEIMEIFEDEFGPEIEFVDEIYGAEEMKQAAISASVLVPQFMRFYSNKHRDKLKSQMVSCSYPSKYESCFAPASPDELLMWCMAGRVDALKHVDSFLWDYWVDNEGADLERCPFKRMSKGVCNCRLGEMAPGCTDANLDSELGVTEKR